MQFPMTRRELGGLMIGAPLAAAPGAASAAPASEALDDTMRRAMETNSASRASSPLPPIATAFSITARSASPTSRPSVR